MTHNDTSLTIDDFRDLINEADAILLTALGTRFKGIQFLRRYKKLSGLPIQDRAREDVLRDRWKTLARKEGVPEALALLILDCIIVESKRIQSQQ